MIFVTVGTTSFDSLINCVDEFAAKNVNMPHKIICQIGSGKYIPEHCSYFRFKPSIDQEIDDADLVITHGGSTVFNLIISEKKFLAVANTDLADNHQSKLLARISSSRDIFWTDDVYSVPSLIESALSSEPLPSEDNNFSPFIDDLINYIGQV